MQLDLFSSNTNTTQHKPIKPTENQRNFKVYTASAGSGKTFQLTLDYLKLALRNPKEKYRRILAITFTNKAANEMKSRIVEAAQAFSNRNEKPLEGRNQALFEALLKQTNWTEHEIEEQSKILFQEIIHNYSDFSISTIDSFSQRLIQSFAFELNIPMNFAVEINEEETIEILSAQLLSKVGTNSDLSYLISQFFETKLIENGSTNIQEDIANAANAMLKEENHQGLTLLLGMSIQEIKGVYDQLQIDILEQKNRIREIRNSVYDILNREGLVKTDFKNKNASFLNAFDKAIKNFDTKSIFNPTFINAIYHRDDWFSQNSTHDDVYFRDEIEQLGRELYELYPIYAVNRTIYLAFPQFALIAELFRLYKAYQHQEDLVLIKEINHLIAKEVRDQPAPFLYEKMGEQYQHILIDEFQDTSKMQWHNLVPLITENLSRGGRRESLVVGDAKQAIYQFRGGKVEQLPELPKLLDSNSNETLQMHEAILEQNFVHDPLKSNYRSAQEIVEFNNELFDFLLKIPELSVFQKYYRNHTQIAELSTGGYVKLEKTTEAKRKRERDEHTLEVLWKDIQSAIQRNALEDIAVLCPKNVQLQKVANLLIEQNIPFTSKKSLLLKQEKHIRLFPSLLELLHYPANQIIQAELANGMIDLGIVSYSKHEMNVLISKKKMRSLQDFNNFAQSFNPSINLLALEHASLFSQFELFCSWLPAQLQTSPYTSFFRNNIYEFVQQNGNDIHSFLHWWQLNQNKLYIETDRDKGIQLMTIHASKGLEFDVVFLPFITDFYRGRPDLSYVKTDILGEQLPSVFIPPGSSLEGTSLNHVFNKYQEDQLLAELNAIYVATTRASKELYIYIPEQFSKSDDMNMQKAMYLFLGDRKTLTIGNTPNKQKQKAEKDTWFIQPAANTFGQAELVVKNRSNAIWNDEIRDRIDYGEIVHALLESIETAQDLPFAIEQSIANGWISESERDEITTMLRELITHPKLQDFFSNTKRVLAEQPIMTPEGKQYIPDRLLIENQQVQILDFKTGKSNLNKHKTQLLHYASILESMHYQVIEKKLVYVSPLEIVEL